MRAWYSGVCERCVSKCWLASRGCPEWTRDLGELAYWFEFWRGWGEVDFRALEKGVEVVWRETQRLHLFADTDDLAVGYRSVN
jgi:hypothetical protein